MKNQNLFLIFQLTEVVKSYIRTQKAEHFWGDAEMEKTKHNKAYRRKETNAAIYEVVCELLEKDVNAAACLTQHATRLSFAACDDTRSLKQSGVDVEKHP